MTRPIFGGFNILYLHTPQNLDGPSSYSFIHWWRQCSRVELLANLGDRDGLVVESLTPEREVGGSMPTSTMLCPLARYIYSLKSTGNTQEEVAQSLHD